MHNQVMCEPIFPGIITYILWYVVLFLCLSLFLRSTQLPLIIASKLILIELQYNIFD